MATSCRAVTVLCRGRLNFWVCFIFLLGTAACHEPADRISQEIRNIVSAGTPPAYLEGIRWKLVRQIYEDREYRPLWVGIHPLPDRTKDLIENLCDAEREGLRPADYHLDELRRTLERLQPSLHKQRPEAVAVLDLELTRRFLDYGADLLAGRLDPKTIATGWYIRAHRLTIDGTLRGAVQAEEFQSILAPLRPQLPGYAELVKALADYREILGHGGWPRVPGQRGLRRGDRGARVAVLRQRLRITGDLQGWAGNKPVYNRAVAKAVARFQARHGIPSSGVVSRATLAALNVPVQARVRQIQLNLERYRWLPAEFGPRYIYVNIPDYKLYAYDAGKPVLTMRVVVGDEYGKATPVFADLMTFVVFRPYWHVPQKILVREILPRIRRRRSYLLRNQFEVVDAKRESVVLNPRRINWSRVNLNRIRLLQKGGSPTNPLGLVKFMFPNQFAVYLHDTPTRRLFVRRNRTLSHGCVWVEKPVELAEYVLEGRDGWNGETIRQAMEKDHPSGNGGSAEEGQSVTLAQPVPVYLVYVTAFVRDGILNFRPDPYGRDREAIARLGKLSPSTPGLCRELQKLIEG
jgi:murein L,D-transpeptidase YcbB/YkuD